MAPHPYRKTVPTRKHNKIRYAVYLPEYLFAKIDREAEVENVSVAEKMVEWLIATYDRRYGDEEDAANHPSKHSQNLHPR